MIVVMAFLIVKLGDDPMCQSESNPKCTFLDLAQLLMDISTCIFLITITFQIRTAIKNWKNQIKEEKE